MDTGTAQEIKDVFDKLPEPVKKAITSTNTSKQLRTLAEKHQLHMDQWGNLENEVTLTLLAIQPPEDLQKNLHEELGLSEEKATTLVADINAIVFEPIREELERELGHPQAKEEEKSDIEKVRDAVLAEAKRDGSLAASTQSTPATAITTTVPTVPAAPEPTQKEPASGAYRPGEASTERHDVVDDPYRETP